ncbi:MAG: hypothetical protein HC828_16225 [Blastochloris sp.]|nr:hypothetical protein [Blastochloris sp.]
MQCFPLWHSSSTWPAKQIGYIDAVQGFRYQVLIAAAGGATNDPGVLNALHQGQDLDEGRNRTGDLQTIAAELGSSDRKQLVAAFRADAYSYIKPGEPDPVSESAALQIVTLDYANGLDKAPLLNRWIGRSPNSGFVPSGLAAGPLGFGDATRDNVVMTTIESQEVVSSDTTAYLYLFGGAIRTAAVRSATPTAPGSCAVRSTTAKAVSAKAAIGELGGKGLGADLVTAVLTTGASNPAIKIETFTNKNQQLTSLASTEQISSANRIALAVGDIDASGQDSIVLAAHIGQDDARRVSVTTWKLVPDPAITTTLVLSRTGSWLSTGISNEQVELALGDLDADGVTKLSSPTISLMAVTSTCV